MGVVKMLKNEEKKYLQEILYYLQHHNKNLTKKQDFLISDLVTLLEKSDILNESEKENLTDMINCRISTPFTNCVIVHLSNGWDILKSYNTTIAMRKEQEVIIDLRYYNYSASTGKHRNYFLGETLKDTDKKIKSGENQTPDLN